MHPAHGSSCPRQLRRCSGALALVDERFGASARPCELLVRQASTAMSESLPRKIPISQNFNKSPSFSPKLSEIYPPNPPFVFHFPPRALFFFLYIKETFSHPSPFRKPPSLSCIYLPILISKFVTPGFDLLKKMSYNVNASPREVFNEKNAPAFFESTTFCF